MNIEQEIRAQIEKNKGLKLGISEINNHLSILEGLLRTERADAQKQVEEAYHKGWEYGKEYGSAEADMREAVSYQKGLNDAWEAAKKIADMWTRIDNDELLAIFGITERIGHSTIRSLFEKQTANKAMLELEAYEEQKADDEIKVGDELEHIVSGCTSKAIFLEKINDDEDWYKCLFWTGCGVTILSYPKRQFKPTGRHYDIDKILEAMKA